MTRINSAIPVTQLTNEHLLAEHREIKRLPYAYKLAVKSGSIKRIPKEFTLGRGHVLFFLDKMTFIMKRYIAIRDECKRRNLAVKDYLGNWFTSDFTDECKQDYTPTEREHDLLVERIKERIAKSQRQYWHYYNKTLTKQDAINLLK